MVLILVIGSFSMIIVGENRSCQPHFHSLFLLTLQYTNFNAEAQTLPTWDCEV